MGSMLDLNSNFYTSAVYAFIVVMRVVLILHLTKAAHGFLVTCRRSIEQEHKVLGQISCSCPQVVAVVSYNESSALLSCSFNQRVLTESRIVAWCKLLSPLYRLSFEEAAKGGPKTFTLKTKQGPQSISMHIPAGKLVCRDPR